VLRRSLDRPSQLLLAHRPDQLLPVLECRREPRIGRAVPVEVCPEGYEDRRSALGRVEQPFDELPPLLFIAAERERLLELVDDEQAGVARGGQLGERMLARREERNPKRLVAPPQRGDDSCAHERRLPASGRPNDRQERRLVEPADELFDELLAAEEDICVVGREPRDPCMDRAHRRAEASSPATPPPRAPPRGRAAAGSCSTVRRRRAGRGVRALGGPSADERPDHARRRA
jgi:hypothetical protein